MEIIIKVENLGKKYIISHQTQDRYLALRDVIASGTKKVVKTIAGKPSLVPKKENLWALRNIDFNIEQGDRVGIIGRNGAGKSTLLKLLSRITEPSEGKIAIKGRVSSLLEVGTGFHPELTGRENVYLNGAILGMGKQEIKKKFDEIVDFAEIEKFLDTPVKRYSSGMYVRLAFAVAAHLDSEILVVDEVLAVGDAQFQKKCLGKMDSVSLKEGRTVLFVSHNMGAIENLCNKCVLLRSGSVINYSNDIQKVISSYLFENGTHIEKNIWENIDNQFVNPWFYLNKFYLTDNEGKILENPVSRNEDIWINIDGTIEINDPALTIGYAIYTEKMELLYWTYHTDTKQENWPKLKKGRNILKSKIPINLLNEGRFIIEVIGSLHFRQWLFEPREKAPSIVLLIQGGLSESPYWLFKRPGILAPIIQWELINS